MLSETSPYHLVMNDVTLKSKELEITKEFYQKSQISSIAKHLVL